jgi:Chromo (CHRromatin Organisation MOdifier) domain
LELPAHWKIFNVFHASLLTLYKETEKHGENFPEPPPDLIDDEPEYKVKEVLASRRYGHWKKLQYLLHWKGYSQAHDSWTLADEMNALELVKKFHDENPMAIRTAVLKEDNWDMGEQDMQSTSPINYITDDFPLLFAKHYATSMTCQDDDDDTPQNEVDRIGGHDHLTESILGGSGLHQLSTLGHVAPGSILFNGSSGCNSEGHGDGESTEPHDPEFATISAPSIISSMGAAADAAPPTTSTPRATSTRLEDIPAHAD